MNKLALLGLVVLLCTSCVSTPKTEPGSADVRQGSVAANSPIAIYSRGQKAIDNGNYREALEYFTSLRKKFPKDKTTPQALLGSGYAYYKLGDNDAAVETSNAFIQTYENHSLIDYAYYLRGLARYSEGIEQLQNRQLSGNARTGMARKSFESFAELVRRFPNSKYSQDSRIRMEVLHSKLAEHELKLAKNALSFNKYKEAIARAEYLIKNYARAEAAPEAYSVMIEAFTAQGDLVQAYDVRKALKRKFPDYHHTESSRISATEVTRVDPNKLKRQQNIRSRPSMAVDSALAETSPPRVKQELKSDAHIRLVSPNTAQAEDFAVDDDGIRREAWYLAQPSSSYTLQLLGTNDENALQAYIEKHDIATEAGYFRSRNADSDWFTLTYGYYRSRNEALLALKGLSAELRAPKPWVRSMSDIQNKISAP